MLANAYLHFKKDVFQLLFQARMAELTPDLCEPAVCIHVNSLCYIQHETEHKILISISIRLD